MIKYLVLIIAYTGHYRMGRIERHGPVDNRKENQ